jgi:hypothetical protein
MALVTGNVEIFNRAADLLATVLHHPQNIMRKASELGQSNWLEGCEEGEVLTAVAASLYSKGIAGERHRPEAELHLLRHLVTRHQLLS